MVAIDSGYGQSTRKKADLKPRIFDKQMNKCFSFSGFAVGKMIQRFAEKTGKVMSSKLADIQQQQCA